MKRKYWNLWPLRIHKRGTFTLLCFIKCAIKNKHTVHWPYAYSCIHVVHVGVRGPFAKEKTVPILRLGVSFRRTSNNTNQCRFTKWISRNNCTWITSRKIWYRGSQSCWIQIFICIWKKKSTLKKNFQVFITPHNKF